MRVMLRQSFTRGFGCICLRCTRQWIQSGSRTVGHPTPLALGGDLARGSLSLLSRCLRRALSLDDIRLLLLDLLLDLPDLLLCPLTVKECQFDQEPCLLKWGSLGEEGASLLTPPFQ